jgi:hypothetical protein
MIKRLSLFLLSGVTLSSLVFSLPAFAVDVFEPCNDPAAKNSTVCQSKEAQESKDRNPLFGEDGIITFIINLVSALVGIAAVITIIVAGLKFITSGSNPQDINNAREMVIYAIAGLVIVVSAQLFVRVFLEKIGV